MKTFTFTKITTETQRDQLVLTLRKAGYSASRETNTITMNASLTIIGLSLACLMVQHQSLNIKTLCKTH